MVENRIGMKINQHEDRIVIRFNEWVLLCERKLKLLIKERNYCTAEMIIFLLMFVHLYKNINIEKCDKMNVIYKLN